MVAFWTAFVRGGWTFGEYQIIRGDYWPFMIGILGLTRLHYARKLWIRNPRVLKQLMVLFRGACARKLLSEISIELQLFPGARQCRV